MIPVKLSINNFMCYADNVPPLSFDGIHTVCISGDNGNGKSALIDAMTWALWGKTRTKSDDNLVHAGSTEMAAEFDFAVGEQLYRIIRNYARPKQRGRSGQSSLGLLIADSSGFKVISGDRISQTQQKVVDILHMDYQTFINSAYLMQGHADEFTSKSPVERKEVLANILQLSLYDELEERAKEMAKQQGEENLKLESAIEEITNELAQKPAYEAEFEQLKDELTRREEDIKERESRRNRLKQEKDTLEGKKTQLAELAEHTADRERELERWQGQAKQHRSRLIEYEGLINQRSSIEDGYAQFLEAKKADNEFDQNFRQAAALSERKHQLEMLITQASQGLVKEHAITQNRITEMEASSRQLPQLKDQSQKLRAQIDRLAAEAAELATKRGTSQELRNRTYYLKSRQAKLEAEIKEIAEKLDLLLTQSDAKCPLCETDLGTEERERIRAKYTAQKDDSINSLKQNQEELAPKKGELELLEKEISERETRLNQAQTSVQRQDSILSKAISEAEAAADSLTEARETLARIEQELASKDFALAEQTALKELEDELGHLGYDPAQHEVVRQRRADLERFEEAQRKLDEASRLLKQATEAALGAEKAAGELQHTLEGYRQKKQTLSQEVASLPQVLSDLAQAETEYQAVAGQQRQSQEAMWGMKAKLERCAELETKKREKTKLLSQASREEKIYRELVQAFGKRGVQALLIEMALPEIEIEANRLLGRMTDNRMHVKIETQRETKKGDVIETLDINISDELGTRNYEMFSGGEAFRINFAIRIALSKMLARRAGAPLPTLIIDEGFGTQDSTGIEKLKEAINSIQDDFKKILAITHVEELKDAFPARISVVKTATGSTLAMG
ncbi:MAG: SMC family ATPase [Chloroflexota bacterium]